MPGGQRRRGRFGGAKLASGCARDRARASAAAEMHQPTPSMHRNRRRMGFAIQVAGGWVRYLYERGMCKPARSY
eukprot:1855803-Pyramimonas_sp.AAC.1